MKIVGFFAAAAQDAQHGRASGDGAFERFQNERRRAFRNDEAVAIPRKWL